MRGRNTENTIIESGRKMADYQGKRYVIMRFIHDENISFFQIVGREEEGWRFLMRLR